MPVDPLTPPTKVMRVAHNKVEFGVLFILMLTTLVAGAFLGAYFTKQKDAANLRDVKEFAEKKLTDIETKLNAIHLVKIRIYLAKGGALVPAERRVLEQLGKKSERLAVDEILEGPTEEEGQLGLTSFIPEGTTLVNFEQVGNAVTLTFSSELNRTQAGNRSMVRKQIERSMLEFSSIRQVIIKIEGVSDDKVLQ